MVKKTPPKMPLNLRMKRWLNKGVHLPLFDNLAIYSYNRLSMSNDRVQIMHTHLQFNVAQLLKELTGGVREYDVDAPFRGKLGEDIITVGPLRGRIKLLRTGPNILVTGALDSLVEKVCARCLTAFSTVIKIELEEIFYPIVDILTGKGLPEPEDADIANRIDKQHILDLTEIVRQEMLLTCDGVLYCKADCRGLCAVCGQNRNEKQCDCQDNQIDARWADLLEISIED